MSSSSSRGPRQVPPPPGSKAAASSPYTRFIPREELGDFAAWKPGTVFGQDGSASQQAAPARAAEPKAPTEREWLERIKAARHAGYADGYRDGLVALEGFKQTFASQATAQIGQLLASFDAELGRLEATIAESVAGTAIQLARQLLRSELATDPALVAAVATDAVNAVMLSARHITVHVHPLDLPLVADGAAEALEARGARLMAKPDIARGGVIVESDVGSVDARIATRWAQAAGALGSDEPWDEDSNDAEPTR
jgi:flagellar assembly protein FliH